MTTIDIQKNVNPNFKAVWQSQKPYNVLKGGRNSFKSSVIVLKLVYMMIKYIMKGEKANLNICFISCIKPNSYQTRNQKACN